MGDVSLPADLDTDHSLPRQENHEHHESGEDGRKQIRTPDHGLEYDDEQHDVRQGVADRAGKDQRRDARVRDHHLRHDGASDGAGHEGEQCREQRHERLDRCSGADDHLPRLLGHSDHRQQPDVSGRARVHALLGQRERVRRSLEQTDVLFFLLDGLLCGQGGFVVLQTVPLASDTDPMRDADEVAVPSRRLAFARVEHAPAIVAPMASGVGVKVRQLGEVTASLALHEVGQVL
mmetsp:Transcript_73192/g.211893  ORF Transcript_73192/g.211893 Transcript_73192/m.211893 type:complete len:234 (-) Transcript_73192:1633-2334(-)